MVHRLRRERNCIKENCLRLEVLILIANSVVPSRSNQHLMSTIFPHTSVSIHYKSVAWKAPVRTVEWFSIVGKKFGTYRRAFNSLSSTGPCLLVFKQFPVKGNAYTQPIQDGKISLSTADRAPLFLTMESQHCDHNALRHPGSGTTDQSGTQTFPWWLRRGGTQRWKGAWRPPPTSPLPLFSHNSSHCHWLCINTTYSHVQGRVLRLTWV